MSDCGLHLGNRWTARSQSGGHRSEHTVAGTGRRVGRDRGAQGAAPPGWPTARKSGQPTPPGSRPRRPRPGPLPPPAASRMRSAATAAGRWVCNPGPRAQPPLAGVRTRSDAGSRGLGGGAAPGGRPGPAAPLRSREVGAAGGSEAASEPRQRPAARAAGAATPPRGHPRLARCSPGPSRLGAPPQALPQRRPRRLRSASCAARTAPSRAGATMWRLPLKRPGLGMRAGAGRTGEGRRGEPTRGEGGRGRRLAPPPVSAAHRAPGSPSPISPPLEPPPGLDPAPARAPSAFSPGLPRGTPPPSPWSGCPPPRELEVPDSCASV